ncbi:MAG TPA: hypothetical protein VGM93_04015, partial [Acidimicrobiales bacterium]
MQVGITGGTNTEELSVQGVGCSNSTTLTTTGEVDVYAHGKIGLSSTGCAGTDSALAVGTTATIHGTLAADVGNGGNRQLAGTFVSDGTIQVDEPLTASSPGSITNKGTLNATALFNVSGSASFVNDSGTIASTGAGQVEATSSSTFTERAGTTTGTPILVSSSHLAFTGSGASSFVANAAVTVAGDVSAGQLLTIQAVGCSFSTSVTAGASFTNAGSIHLSSAGCAGATSTLVVPAGDTLTNSGTISSDVANGGARFLEATVVNTGSMVVNQSVTYDQPGTRFTNQGSIDLATGTVFSFTANGSELRNQSGHIVSAGTGQVQMGAGTTFTQVGGDTSGTPVLVTSGTLAFTGSGAPAAFVTHASVAVSGNIAAGQSVTVEAVGCSFSSSLTGSASFVNAGTIHLSSGGCAGATSTLSMVAGTLTNNGTISVDLANGGARFLEGAITNAAAGTVKVDQPLTYDTATTFTNQGLLTLTQPFTVTSSGATFLGGAGTISASGLGQVVVSG